MFLKNPEFTCNNCEYWCSQKRSNLFQMWGRISTEQRIGSTHLIEAYSIFFLKIKNQNIRTLNKFSVIPFQIELSLAVYLIHLFQHIKRWTLKHFSCKYFHFQFNCGLCINMTNFGESMVLNNQLVNNWFVGN